MTCSSIKIIYLTILWTLVCPSLQCFSLLNPNYIILLTSIQSLQSLPITLKVPEESYDQITKVLKNNPNLLNQLIAQSGNPTSKMSLLPQGGQLTNGIPNFLPNFGTGLPSVKNPVTVALPTETMIGGQKFVLTNRANLYGNLFKKLASAVISPLKQSFSYFKNVGQNQGITQDVLKLISNNLNNKNEKVVGEVEVEESSEEEEEERPKRSKKKKGSTKKKVSKISDDDDDDEGGNEAKNKKKKGASKTNANNKSPEKSSEENNNDEEDESDDGGEKNAGRTKGGNPKKNSGSGSGSSTNGGRGASSDSTEGGSSNGSGSVSDSGSGEN